MASQSLQSAPLVLQEIGLDCSPDTLAAARQLLLEYGHFVASYPNVSSFCFGTLEKEVAGLPHSYLNQQGGSLIAFAGLYPVGFVAWRSLPAPQLASAWELKRLWLRPEARGLGAGQALIQAVIQRAAAAHKSVLLLDTSPDAMAAACRLYRRLGFVECPPYAGPALPGIVYMCKTLE